MQMLYLILTDGGVEHASSTDEQMSIVGLFYAGNPSSWFAGTLPVMSNDIVVENILG
jgi:hypothetical protein